MIKLDYRSEPLKKTEFLNLMVSRIKKQCKIMKIHPGKKIKINAEGSNYEIAKKLLEKAFKKVEIEHSVKGIEAISIEEHASKILDKMTELKLIKVNNLFAKYTIQDLQELSKLFKLPYKKPKIHSFVDGIMKKHPDTAFSLINSLESLSN